MPSSFELRAVRAGPPEDPILKSLTVDVPCRGITALAGPSGSGKTSLLRLLNRLDDPIDGSIRWEGRDLREWDPIELRREVAMVFQRPPVFPGTVLENLRVAMPSVDTATATAALDRVGLAASMLDREATDLSGGEAQRMCLARALLTEPSVVLADEPTASLDRASRRAVEALGRRLADDGMPLVWVSHDVEQLRRLADHVIVLVAGRVVAADTLAELDRHDDPLVREVGGRLVIAQTDIGLVGMAASGILVAVALAVSMWRRLGLERSLLWSCLRALVQLLVVGWALHLIVDDDDPLIYSGLWLVVMISLAGYTTWKRATDVPAVLPLSLLAYAASAAVTLGVLFGFQVYELEGRTIVPLAGIVVGNSLSATVLVSRRLFAAADDHRELIEARLALGLSAADAFHPDLRESLRTALVPQIETTKAVGIIALPGAMVGLILAGTDPTEAVRVQLSVMYLVLGSVATTTAVMSLGISRQLFTGAQQLKRF